MANETNNKNFRIESDLLGELQVPANAYYGVQTQRAVNNYHISGKRMCDYPDYVIAMAYVKLAAVETNRELGEINNEICDAMAQACREIIDGKFHEDFVTDMVQGGELHAHQSLWRLLSRQPTRMPPNMTKQPSCELSV